METTGVEKSDSTLDYHDKSEQPDPQSQNVESYVQEIFGALSNVDSFEIFKLSFNGIDATTDVLEEHRFSRKRYYVRLKELVNLGLVHKNSGKYKQTGLGNVVYECVVNAIEHAVLRQNAQLINTR